MNSVTKKIGMIAVAVTTLALWGGSTGCKTDAIANPKPGPALGPTTSLEHPAGVQLPDIPVADANEVDLVEKLLLHRAMYANTLRVLATFYSEH